MKTFMITILLMVSSVLYAQSSKQIDKIDENLYSVVIKDGSIKQTGYYTEIDGMLVEHGEWTLRSNKTVLTRGTFSNGILQEIVVYENGERKRYTRTDLEINRLKSKIYKLENMLLTAVE